MKFILALIINIIILWSSFESKWFFLKPFEQWGGESIEKFFFSFKNPEEHYMPLKLSTYIKFSWK